MKTILTLFLLTIFVFQSCKNKEKDTQKKGMENVQVELVDKQKMTSKKELENEILKIIIAFENKDEKTLNAYIDKNIDLYLIPGPGTLSHFEVLEKIDFSNTDLSYHEFGKQSIGNYRFKYEKFPEYNCETHKWNKYGIFVATEYGSVLNEVIENPQNLVEGKIYSEDEIRMVKNIDKITKAVIIAKKDGDIDFGIAKINSRYIITYLNIQKSYCDI